MAAATPSEKAVEQTPLVEDVPEEKSEVSNEKNTATPPKRGRGRPSGGGSAAKKAKKVFTPGSRSSPRFKNSKEE